MIIYLVYLGGIISGTILAVQYGMDVHYQEDGEWTEIDNRFLYEEAKTTEDFHGFATAQGEVEFKFAPQVWDSEIFKMTHEDHTVGVRLLPKQAELTAGLLNSTALEVQNQGQAATGELSQVPIAFLKGEVLNPEAVPEEEEQTEEVKEILVEAEEISVEEEVLIEKTEEIPVDEELLAEEETLAETEEIFVEEDMSEEEEKIPAEEEQPIEEGEISAEEEIPAEEENVPAEEEAPAEEEQPAEEEEISVEEVPVVEEALPEVIWVDTAELTPEAEEAALMEAVKAEEAVTSVGYGNVLPGISLQYVVAGSSLKEYILVNQKAEAYSYDFQMNLGNLVPQIQEDGSILLKDPDTGKTVYEIPAGYMTDAAGEYSDAVQMTIQENADGSYLLNVTADAQWINAPEREFPVQIDPTINHMIESLSDIRGSYVAEGYPTTSNVQYGNLMVGYDSSGSKQLRTYIQLRNLPELPKDSVICGAMCHFGVVNFSYVTHTPLLIRAKEITSATTWSDKYTWNSKPSVSSTILDYRAVDSSLAGSYIGWNITDLVKAHYLAGNASGSISAFALEPYGGSSMTNTNCAKTTLRLTRTTAYPILQVMYRDTKGIEGYYTYQTHDAGIAGTAYVGDYTAQLTAIKPLASYESTVMSYGLNLVYNSAYSDKFFTNDNKSIHTKDFTTTNLGAGWKLSAQETVTTVSLEDVNSSGTTQTTWLIYNDSDGTEHYFKKSESDSSKYEDEDGLNLTITKSGSDFTMTDKQDNQKFFKNGYLTKITDANGNAIHIVYNGGTASSNTVNSSGANRITSVYSQPKGAAAEVIFTLIYDSSNRLTNIHEAHGNSYQLTYMTDGNGVNQLQRVYNYDEASASYVEVARYDYGGAPYILKGLRDIESNRGIYYDYEKSMTGYRICRFYEYASANNSNKGNIVWVNADELRKTVYRDTGTDRTKDTADDIITTYLFNSSGQTINVSTRDQQGNILGVSASAYEQTSGTSGKNNRMVNSTGAGQSGATMLLNGGFEKYSGTAANGWTHVASGGTVTCKTTDSHSGKAYYELVNTNTTSTQMLYQTAALTAGTTYTGSMYVNTSAMTEVATGGGAYLKITDASGNQIAKGTVLQYATDEDIDNGWQRISVTFTPSSSADYRMYLVWEKAKGILKADEAQLEAGDAPGSFNHVYNGSFENGEDGWTLSDEDLESVKTGAEYFHGTSAFRTNGYPETVLYAEQQIPLHKSSDTTFLLSGWSKGTAVPDLESICDELTDKFWGITVKLRYTDGTSEKHHLPFNEYVREWQYAAMAVVPKASGKTILYAEVRACFFNTANRAYFDHISLTEEPAQTYKYDDEGNVTKVSSTGNGDENYSYDSTTQNLLSVGTEGSGTYSYKYENSANKHLPTSITNDTVTMNVAYDSYGQSTNTTLVNSSDDWKMSSSAAYINGLMTSQTDNTGAVTKYTYNDRRQVESVENAKGQVISTEYDNVYGRTTGVSQSGKASVDYGYSSGDLSTITRNGYITSGGTEQAQTYRFAYDDFGNRTSVSVGNRQLAGYTYNSGNGTMSGMTYGSSSSPLATVSYGYDKLDRVKTVTYHDTNSGENTTYGYNYSADGSLAGITEDNELKYTYEYDSLGRLIYSSRLEDGKTKLYTSHQYDTSDRLTEQSWQIGNDSFTESYAYSSTDGTLSSMTAGGDTLGFTYNSLKQLSGRTSTKLDIAYGYRTRNASDKLTTNQVETVQYLKAGTTTQLLPTLKYTYDSLWNITKVESGTSTTAQYTYDEQNQLTREVIPSKTADYTYDTYGNIRSKANTYTDGSTDSYTFSYENSDWLDLLTKVSYTDKNGSTTSQSLTYDAIGNPLSYFNGKESWSFTWKNGRQLTAASNGSETITNTYDVDGIRETKTVNGVTHTYTTLSDKIVREVYGTTTIDYLYDNDGRPYKLIIDENGITYTGYFVLNLQGDVIAIIDQNGAAAVQYKYDAWGKQVSYTTSGSYGSKLYGYNALKYRGYYYDAETGFYYVSSRYYDPEVGRFLNADGKISGVGGDIRGYNLYSYCFNNPVNMSDPDGNFPKWAKKVVAGAAIIAVAAIVTVATGGTGLVGAVAAGALKGAVIGGAIGAATGAAVSAVKHRSKTGSWKGAGKAARNGAADGFMKGTIAGAVSEGAKAYSSAKSVATFVSRGSTAKRQPQDLIEQLALEQVKSNPQGTQLPITMTDPRWPASEGWVKMQQIVSTSKGNINVHYLYNQTLNVFDDFKLK